MTILTTCFDSGFLVRGAACLLSALREASEPLALHVLALNEECAQALPRLLEPLPPGCSLTIRRLAELEAREPRLSVAKETRSRIEYYFTLTPFLCRDALSAAALGDFAIYVDADTWFAADPIMALAETSADAAILVTEHRYPPPRARLAETYGRFNVGWLGFRRCDAAERCLAHWAEQCLEWCGLEPNAGRFGDQKYLDAWPRTFVGVEIVDHPGLNLAPWNLETHRVEAGREGVTVDGRPLIMFHFHRLQSLGGDRFVADLHGYGRLAPVVARSVYLPYIAELDELSARCRRLGIGMAPELRKGNAEQGCARRLRSALARAVRVATRHRVVFAGGRPLSPLGGLIHGD